MRKMNVKQIIRHTVQLLGFIFLPGLFILTLSSIEAVLKALIAGSATFESLRYQIFILLAVLPVTALWGRVFCGYLCAFGSMQELLGFIGRKAGIKPLHIPEKASKLLKKAKYAILLALVIAWVRGLRYSELSPWNVFGLYSSPSAWSDLSGFISAGGLILALIILGSLFHDRLFCNFLCPLGAVFESISRFRLFGIKKRDNCVGCGLCGRKCPMGIDVNGMTEKGRLKSGECIDCFRCVDACRPKSLYTCPKEAVAGTAAAAAIAGIYYLGTITPPAASAAPTPAAVTAEPSEPPSGTAVITELTAPEVSAEPADVVTAGSEAGGQYTDGVYTGTGTGFRGDITVEVEVSGGYISSITVKSSRDDAQFFNRANPAVANEIIESQSINVKTVSGATYSSNGIIEAVAKALGIDFTNPNSSGKSRGGHR